VKKLILILSLAIILLITAAFPGCSSVGSSMNGSGQVKEQELKLTDFNTINVHGPFELEIVRDSSFKVVLSTDDNLISRVRGSLDRKTLMLSIEAPATFFPSKLKVSITMPDIAGLSLSDAAKATMSGFSSFNDFNVYLNKGSNLNGAIEADDVSINLTGASQAAVAGKSRTLDLQCSAGSKLDMTSFQVTRAQVKLKEASEATLNVSGELDVVMSDASKIYYLGNPIISDTSISSGSTMIRK
jgi:hypothetical protein